LGFGAGRAVSGGRLIESVPQPLFAGLGAALTAFFATTAGFAGRVEKRENGFDAGVEAGLVREATFFATGAATFFATGAATVAFLTLFFAPSAAAGFLNRLKSDAFFSFNVAGLLGGCAAILILSCSALTCSTSCCFSPLTLSANFFSASAAALSI